MPTLLPDSPPVAIAEALAQAIASNARLLRLLDPQRYGDLLKTLPADPSSDTLSAPESFDEAWDDVERWMAHFREKDRENPEV